MLDSKQWPINQFLAWGHRSANFYVRPFSQDLKESKPLALNSETLGNIKKLKIIVSCKRPDPGLAYLDNQRSSIYPRHDHAQSLAQRLIRLWKWTGLTTLFRILHEVRKQEINYDAAINTLPSRRNSPPYPILQSFLWPKLSW